MTPEGSEPLVELPSSEEENSAVPSSSSSSSSSKNEQIRVKNVSEINSNEAEANPSAPNKRKLPSWMLLSSQQSQSTNNKKIKANHIADASTSSASPAECIVTHSTSASHIHDDTDRNDSTTNDEQNADAEPVQSAEIIATANNEADEAEASVSPSASVPPIASTSDGQGSSTSAAKIKTEPNDEEDNEAVGVITPTSARDIKPAVKVEKEEATSSTTRPTCRFGIRCYRQNPTHRREEAHPGDKDYKRPDFPTPPDGTPSCPYGDLCYRRNPVHFQQYSHPPSTDFEQNYKNYKMRLRKRKQPVNDPNLSYSDLDDDEDDNDPFINDDSDDEFIPNSADMDNEDDDDLL